jgi:hypothetical protein
MDEIGSGMSDAEQPEVSSSTLLFYFILQFMF